MSTTPKIRLTKRGVIQPSPDGDREIVVAPPIRLVARGQRQSDGSYIAQFRFREMNGADKSVYVEWALTLPEKRRELRSILATAGYSWPRNNGLSDAIWAALVDTTPRRRFDFATAPGWYEAGFALPGRYFCPGDAADPVKIDPNSIEHVSSFTTGEGILRDWQRHVARPARKSSPMCVSISAAFAAPLLRKLNMDSFAINWFGDTSGGKTLTLKVAASVAGLFGPGGGIPSWADSEAGFEGQAMGHRDCILPLDETADGEKEMPLEKRARLLAFAIGRNRPRTLSSGYEKAHGLTGREYRIIVLSSSERALNEVAIKAGSRRLGGEEVRLIDVPATESGSHGVFDRGLETGDAGTALEAAKRLADTLAASARRYQGHAFVAFLRRLVRDQDWEATVQAYKAQFEREVTAPASTAIYRIRSNFAIIWAAGVLAID
jgi:putative DNA primase/helicase